MGRICVYGDMGRYIDPANLSRLRECYVEIGDWEPYVPR